MRRAGLKSAPNSTLWPEGGTYVWLGEELRIVTEWLGKADVRRYLAIDKGRRFYSCPHCLDECDKNNWEYVRGVAQLASKDRTETTLRCVACGFDSTVKREKCRDPECKGNVLWPENDNYCLTCRNWY